MLISTILKFILFHDEPHKKKTLSKIKKKVRNKDFEIDFFFQDEPQEKSEKVVAPTEQE